ncbi:MAG: hypothetical protein P794_08805 [Epsilonproteobacteria bacterium (ex Lamellibrachia satsuma)]|nr:MAG: hypothetical protein P794_08805 [Epsilonproteobacteria bacterium (ex Lamellibrachia satsuma)]
MKTVIILAILVCNLMAISAQDAAWVLDAQTGLNKAYQKAEAEKKKLVLLVIVKDGCHWCESMVFDTLKDKDIQENLADIVTVVADVNDKLPKEFKATATPAMFFIDVKTKKSVLENVGYIKKGGFLIDIISAKDMVE